MTPQLCQVGVVCDGKALATQRHHRKRRSQGGPNTVANLLLICADCHWWIHNHPKLSFENGWLVKSHVKNEDLASVPFSKSGEGAHSSATDAIHDHAEIEPGTECPTCHRRVPRPKDLQDGPRKRGTWSVKVPKYTLDEEKTILEEDGAQLLDEDIEEGRKYLVPLFGWEPNVPAYFVLKALTTIAVSTLRDEEESHVSQRT